MPKKDKRFKNSDRQPRARRQLDTPDYASGVGMFIITSVTGNGREGYAQFLNCCPDHERDDYAGFMEQYPGLFRSDTQIVLRLRDLRVPRSFKLQPDHTIVAAMIPPDLRLGSWNSSGNVMTGIILKVYTVDEVNELRDSGYIPLRIVTASDRVGATAADICNDADDIFEHDAEDFMEELGYMRSTAGAAAQPEPEIDFDRL